jgi:hypothetical protein
VLGEDDHVRERGVWSQHLLASSITELSMFVHHREMCTPGDLALLVREGYVVPTLGDDHILTPKGTAEIRKEDGHSGKAGRA